MPELPEVETIASALRHGGRTNPPVVGRRIEGVHLLWERTLAAPAPAEFLARLPGQTILNVDRRGKFLLFQLARDWLLLHLRMSGDIWVEPLEAPLAPHHRLLLDLDAGLRLAFNDTRKFGRVWLVRDPGEVVSGLGPEPFSLEFSPDYLQQQLQGRRRQIKPVLLDQSVVAGLGNIYTDEALFLARLHPQAEAAALARPDIERLWAGIRQALTEGLQHQGASIDWVYRGGNFQNYFRVYDRAGQPCTVCGTPIKKIVVGQRGTHFCPSCQPEQRLIAK
jgi:formamidopyrimidine-DNA glycosylase